MVFLSPYAVNIFLSFIWALYIVLSRFAVQYLPLMAVGLFSRSIAVIGLIMWIWKGRKKGNFFYMQGKGGLLFLVGFFAFLLDASSFLGLKFSTAINGSVLLRMDIVFIILFSYFFLKEKFHPGDWLSLLLMVGGALLVMKENLLNFRLQGWGDLMFILSAFFITCNAFIIKLKLSSLPDETIAFYNNLFATLFYALFFLWGVKWVGVKGEFTPFLPLVLFLMGVCDVFLYITYYYSLRHLPVWIVRSLLLLIPGWSILLGYFFLKERMETLQSLGMILLIGGAGTLIWRRKGRKNLLFLKGVKGEKSKLKPPSPEI